MHHPDNTADVGISVNNETFVTEGKPSHVISNEGDHPSETSTEESEPCSDPCSTDSSDNDDVDVFTNLFDTHLSLDDAPFTFECAYTFSFLYGLYGSL